MKIRLTLSAWMNIRDLLFSILYKNENKAYIFAWMKIKKSLIFDFA
ncbi:hypothetical protein [Wolbachia endosymbiont of Ctenocephalides felis wCfeJ]|nr:hypothetical protein [Wolbachia endosymbiont of Ctenocephalides felis wCfeJ]WCR57641.1 MAG: hypothetical protein PG980_000113 [Wolbachia endosymbiont of Ctenocephalides felis wCfeJ]